MAGGSTVFEWACGLLENLTTMSRLQARGTLRLVLGSAGLDIETLSGRQFRVVAMKLLAKELRARAIADPEGICTELMCIPADVEAGAGLLHPTPADVFKRLGRKE
jgi:hypothetical protein